MGSDVIDLTLDSDEEPAVPAKRPRTDAGAAEAAVPPPAPAPSANALLAALHAERLARGRGGAPAEPAVLPRAVASAVPVSAPLSELKLLTYNIWFADVAQRERMQAIGEVIAAASPHVVALQEVTPELEAMLRAGSWASSFTFSPSPRDAAYYTLLAVRRTFRSVDFRRTPFPGSRMGRDVTSCVLELGGGRRMCVATSHLESFISKTQTSSRERLAQLAAALSELSRASSPTDAIYAGDMNWDDGEEGPMEKRLSGGWADAWPLLRPGEPGLTYDAPSNAMLMGGLKKRLDRVVVRSESYAPSSIAMVGREAIRGVTFIKEDRYRGGSKQMPVLPSDHYGLLYTARLRLAPL
jgi:tyrosyl-DNA phosphodiesterase 2